LLEAGDRRRILFASALTLVALPFLYSAKRDSHDATPNVAAVAPGAGDASAALVGDASAAPDTRADETSAPADPSAVRQLAAPATTVAEAVTIGVAASPGAQTSDGTASYKRWTSGSAGLAPCATRLTVIGVRLVVTNTDNGHRVACRVVSNDVPDGVTVVIETDLFLDLADLVEAPVPVSLSW
jgi:hypothetical protein